MKLNSKRTACYKKHHHAGRVYFTDPKAELRDTALRIAKDLKKLLCKEHKYIRVKI